MIAKIIIFRNLKMDNSVESFPRIEQNANVYQFSKNNLTIPIIDL